MSARDPASTDTALVSGEATAASPMLGGAVFERLISIPLALGTGAILGIAAWLEPAAQGHGTHTQLGLGSCSFLTLTGHPCPMCGATTSFTLMAELQPLQALFNQPFASLLFVLTLITFGVSVAEIVQPRRRFSRLLDRIEPIEQYLAAAFLGFMGLAWIWKAYLMGSLVPGV